MGDAEGKPGVFAECSIAFVPSNSLAPKLISEVSGYRVTDCSQYEGN